MYYTHNLQFLAASAAMEGRSADSRDAAKKTTALATPLAKEMPMAEFVVPFEMYFALRFEKWDDVLALPEPDAGLATTVALWHFGRAGSRWPPRRTSRRRSRTKAFRRRRVEDPARRDDEPQRQQGSGRRRRGDARCRAGGGARRSRRRHRGLGKNRRRRGQAELRRAARLVLPGA
jgi:hypothetical protein